MGDVSVGSWILAMTRDHKSEDMRRGKKNSTGFLKDKIFLQEFE